MEGRRPPECGGEQSAVRLAVPESVWVDTEPRRRPLVQGQRTPVAAAAAIARVRWRPETEPRGCYVGRCRHFAVSQLSHLSPTCALSSSTASRLRSRISCFPILFTNWYTESILARKRKEKLKRPRKWRERLRKRFSGLIPTDRKSAISFVFPQQGFAGLPGYGGSERRRRRAISFAPNRGVVLPPPDFGMMTPNRPKPGG